MNEQYFGYEARENEFNMAIATLERIDAWIKKAEIAKYQNDLNEWYASILNLYTEMKCQLQDFKKSWQKDRLPEHQQMKSDLRKKYNQYLGWQHMQRIHRIDIPSPNKIYEMLDEWMDMMMYDLSRMNLLMKKGENKQGL